MKVLKQLQYHLTKGYQYWWCYLTKGHQYCLERIAGTDVYTKHCSECGYVSQYFYDEDGTRIQWNSLSTGPK